MLMPLIRTHREPLPPESTDLDSTAPVTPSKSIRRMLIPGVAMYQIVGEIKTLPPECLVRHGHAPDTGGDKKGDPAAADDVFGESPGVGNDCLK